MKDKIVYKWKGLVSILTSLVLVMLIAIVSRYLLLNWDIGYFIERPIAPSDKQECIVYIDKKMIVNNKELWISFPFEVLDDGFYNFEIGGLVGKWDIRIDGEKHTNLIDLYFKRGKTFICPVYIERGMHSITAHLKNRSVPFNYDNFCFIAIKLIQKPKTYISTHERWKRVNNYSKMLRVGEMFSGSYINVNIARDMAIFSRNGYQYISYFNPEGFLVIGRRQFDLNHFEKYWLPLSTGKALLFQNRSAEFHLVDPHNYISMQMDGEGYIHVCFGHDNSQMKYIKSILPYDISLWSAQEKQLENAFDETNVTYVSFVRLASGNLLALFRIGYSGNGYERILHYDISTHKWRRIYSPFIDGEGKASPYFWRPVVSPDGIVHLAWTWRISKFHEMEDSPLIKERFSGFTNKDICYAKSPDEGMNWYRSDGSRYLMPITRSSATENNAEIVEKIPMGESFFNHYGSDYDSLGDPHFTYSRWNAPSSGVTQQWHLFWDGKQWRANMVSHYMSSWKWTRPQQEGKASTYLTRPSLIVAKDNSAIVISRSRENANSIELYYSKGNDYNSWRQMILLKESVGGWEPQMDLDLWHSQQILDLLLLGITDKAVKVTYSRNITKKIIMNAKRLAKGILQKRKIKRNQGKTDYYSKDYSVPLQQISNFLKENVGYILEVDAEKIIREAT